MFEKPLRMLGLATKAGKVITGAELSQKADRDGKAKLIIIAKDAKDSTKKEFCNAKSPVIELGTKESLGKMTGKDIRSVVSVTDKGFAEVILKEAGKLNVTEN